MRQYEMMLIAPAEADDKVIGAITDRVSQVLDGGGGRITNVDQWGRRRFAYPIGKLTEGSYLVIEFTAEAASLKELERVLSLADDVVRFKVVVRPESAARTGSTETEAPAAVASEAGPAAEDVSVDAGDAGGDETPGEESSDADAQASVSNTGAR